MRIRFFNLKTVFAMVVCMLLAPVFGPAAFADDWTFMVYIGGDNNLSEAAEKDIEEMRTATFGSDVNVVVLAELSNQYSFSPPGYLGDFNTHLLEVSGQTVTDVGGALGNLNMGDPATLEWVIETVSGNYPADHYALVIWDHGNGWKNTRWPAEVRRGAVEDQASGSFMTLAQLSQGVRSSGVHLDLIDFDACLMAMYEVTYEFIGLVDFLVFSEDVEPGDGNPYTPLLNALGSNPGMSPAVLAATIVGRFKDSYNGGRESVTKSAVDMAEVAALHAGVQDLAAELQGVVSTNWTGLNNIINQTQSYTLKPNKDLWHFLNNLSALGGSVAAKAAVLATLVDNDVVISNDYYSSTSATASGLGGSTDVSNSHGLAIFLPTAEELQEGEFSAYQAISSNAAARAGAATWADFLQDYLTGSGGGTGATGAYEVQDGGFAFLAVWFDDFNLLGDADVDLYVFEPDGTLGAPWISQSTPNGFFSPDSFDIGMPYEMYGAKQNVVAGDYIVLANYYADGFWDNYANVLIGYMNPGDAFWQLIPGASSKTMSFFNPAPQIWDDAAIYGIINGFYSDWWIPFSYSARAFEDLGFEAQKEMLLKAKSMADKRRKVNLQDNLTNLYDFLQTDGNGE